MNRVIRCCFCLLLTLTARSVSFAETEPQTVSLWDGKAAETPPTFLFHTQEDTVVHPDNSLAFYSAMVKHKVPGELHFFQKGKHGVGLAAGIAGTEKWPELCRLWMAEHEFIAGR